MTDKKFMEYFRRSVLILIFCLVLCIVARITFACTVASEQKAHKDDPIESNQEDTKMESHSSHDTAESEPESEVESETNAETEDATLDDIVLKPTADAGIDYINDIVFLGDSTTYGLAYFNAVNKNQVWTGAGADGGTNGTLSLYTNIDQIKIYYPDEDCALTIGEAAARKKPKYLVVTLKDSN